MPVVIIIGEFYPTSTWLSTILHLPDDGHGITTCEEIVAVTAEGCTPQRELYYPDR